MRATDFVSLARRLGKDQDECSQRCAASLAYYGAFHFAGERLEHLTSNEPNSFQWSGQRKSHTQLPVEWRTRLGESGRIIATSLFNAHELRKKADYDVDLAFTAADKDDTFGFVAQVLWTARQVR